MLEMLHYATISRRRGANMMLAKKYSRQEVCQVLSFLCFIYHFEPLERKLIYSIICVMLLISFTYSQSN
ncbi:MAG: hypothetical protein QXP16_06260, partial [Candidatus Bathyarchaeia archaeon]